MNKVALFLITLSVCFFISCSSSDDGMKSNELDIKTEFLNVSLVQQSSIDYTSFNYSVRSTAATPLDGRMELTTQENKVYRSEYFSIAPNSSVKVSVLVEGAAKNLDFIKSQKVYTRPAKVVKDPLL